MSMVESIVRLRAEVIREATELAAATEGMSVPQAVWDVCWPLSSFCVRMLGWVSMPVRLWEPDTRTGFASIWRVQEPMRVE